MPFISKESFRAGNDWLVEGQDVDTKGTAEPGDTYPAEVTVTAEDQTNADKLAALGYVVAGGETADWTAGEYITVGTFRFSWDGTAWAPGTGT